MIIFWAAFSEWPALTNRESTTMAVVDVDESGAIEVETDGRRTLPAAVARRHKNLQQTVHADPVRRRLLKSAEKRREGARRHEQMVMDMQDELRAAPSAVLAKRMLAGSRRTRKAPAK